MCINCNLLLPMEPAAAARLGFPDPGADARVLVTPRELHRHLHAADLPPDAPAPPLDGDRAEETDLAPLLEQGGLERINFTNASQFDWDVRSQHSTPAGVEYAFGTVARKVVDVPEARQMPPGYPLQQLCYVETARMVRHLNGSDGSTIMADIMGGAPAWKVADMMRKQVPMLAAAAAVADLEAEAPPWKFVDIMRKLVPLAVAAIAVAIVAAWRST
jgi:hypothetical protein